MLTPHFSRPRHAADHLLVAARRRTGLRPHRLATGVALLGVAVVLSGTPGLLLAFLALMLILDAAIPLPGRGMSRADERFSRLVRQRRRVHLRGRGPERLDVLDDRTGWAASAERHALGVQPIPLASITGTVEAAQARVFDRAFRPDPSAREHWKRLWMAHAMGVSLPPVSAYRVGEAHVLRDGHHRVSVARDHGTDTIDADVIELRTPAGMRSPPAAPG